MVTTNIVKHTPIKSVLRMRIGIGSKFFISFFFRLNNNDEFFHHHLL